MKIPAGKGNPELLKKISETFAVIPGIEHVTVNPTTGSIVLYCDTDRHNEFHGSFRDHAEAHGAISGASAPSTSVPLEASRPPYDPTSDRNPQLQRPRSTRRPPDTSPHHFARIAKFHDNLNTG